MSDTFRLKSIVQHQKGNKLKVSCQEPRLDDSFLQLARKYMLLEIFRFFKCCKLHLAANGTAPWIV